MPKVKNWQIGRDMEYPYPESKPQKQVAFIFDPNKCIACQTCTMACKTTWTSGKGQEYVFWNNVESKPYGFYPLGWDVQTLGLLGPQKWEGGKYAGKTVFEAAPDQESVLGYLPNERDYESPNLAEDECSASVERGEHLKGVHKKWGFYLARICNHCAYPGCLAACPRKAIYKRAEDGIVLIDQKRCRGYRECVKACPYKKPFYNNTTRVSEKCISCYPKMEATGQQSQCTTNCIGKIRLNGFKSVDPAQANKDNPFDYLIHIRKIALPLYPQFGTQPNVYYIPPVHVDPKYLLQMFGPGAEEAVKAYRNAPNDKELLAALTIFGCAEPMTSKFKAEGDLAVGIDDKGAETARVPTREPSFVREFSQKTGAFLYNNS
ncbi:MAG: dehydrogenase [Nitrospinae bacterium]|nr:dehydrogenase [Nitrospinota bacterium]